VTANTHNERQEAEFNPSSKILSSLFAWSKKQSTWPLIVGECLHISRPLVWAAVEARGSVHRPSLKDWATTLGMDVVSLILLNRHRQFPHGNKQELKRRKIKLFLYILRSPFFERYTETVVSRAGTLSRTIPLIGPLMETYLWDWLLYWKHPFSAEYD
jgi:peroxin-16